MNETTQNIILGVAALGLAYALYRTFAKKSPVGTKSGTTAPSQSGSLDWVNGIPGYTNYAPYDSNTLAGQLGINKLLHGTVGDLYF